MASNIVNGAIVNNVLFFVKKYMHSDTPNSIIECGQNHFKVTHIALAKKLLVTHYKCQLDNIDKELSRRVTKNRRGTGKRATDAVNLKDIYDILDALSSHDVKIDVAPDNIKLIPNVNPESVTKSALSARIVILEENVDSLSNDYN